MFPPPSKQYGDLYQKSRRSDCGAMLIIYAIIHNIKITIDYQTTKDYERNSPAYLCKLNTHHSFMRSISWSFQRDYNLPVTWLFDLT